MKNIFLFIILVSGIARASDLRIMNEARIAFEENKFNKAIELYSLIPKKSDFWFESLEERAWAYTRQGKYEKALGDLKSVTHPTLSAQVGPESLMLSAYISLKTCAYKDALEKVNQFKSRMLPKVEALEALVTSPESSQLIRYFPKIKKNSLSLINLGSKAEQFPRFFHRDRQIIQAAKTNDKLAAYNRIKVLAQDDLDEIEKNLKKMKLIEIEIIHRVSLLTPEMSKKDLKFSKVNKNSQLSFPVEGDELWLDEIGKYQVKAQGCKETL